MDPQRAGKKRNMKKHDFIPQPQNDFFGSHFKALAFWSLIACCVALPVQLHAEETPTHHDHHSMAEEPAVEAPVGEHMLHAPALREGTTESPSVEHQHYQTGLTIEGHKGHLEGHQHRAPILPPDEDKAFSELNHHIAGVFILFAGGLALLAAPNTPRFSWARYGWPTLFFCMGIFLFVRHDPESWPWGPVPLWNSIEDPQVLQHVLFTLIVLGIGAIEWLRCRRTLTHPVWGMIFPVLAISAAGMLFLHKHGSGPVADKIYRHHSIMASAGIAAMLAKVLDDSRLLRSRIGSYLWPGLMMFIGVLLLLYSE